MLLSKYCFLNLTLVLMFLGSAPTYFLRNYSDTFALPIFMPKLTHIFTKNGNSMMARTVCWIESSNSLMTGINNNGLKRWLRCFTNILDKS